MVERFTYQIPIEGPENARDVRPSSTFAWVGAWRTVANTCQNKKINDIFKNCFIKTWQVSLAATKSITHPPINHHQPSINLINHHTPFCTLIRLFVHSGVQCSPRCNKSINIIRIYHEYKEQAQAMAHGLIIRLSSHSNKHGEFRPVDGLRWGVQLLGATAFCALWNVRRFLYCTFVVSVLWVLDRLVRCKWAE